MMPGPSDPALETPLLQKLQGWGVVLVTFFVVWLPYTWLVEPSANLEQEKALKVEAIARGKRSVELFSEENQLGVGVCAVPRPGASWWCHRVPGWLRLPT